MITEHQKYIALSTKHPSLEFRSETDTLSYATITWLNGTYITETEYNLALAEYDAQEYARARQPLYPAIGDQLDDLYHKGAFSAEMTATLKKVKDDNPK